MTSNNLLGDYLANMDTLKTNTVGSLPSFAAKKFQNHTALYFQGKRWTYKDFLNEVDQVARGLIAIGVNPGDKVALWMVNRPEWLFTMYAVAKIGAVLVPLNTRYRTMDVSYTVKNSDSVVWIFQAKSGPVDYFDMVRDNLNKAKDKTDISQNFPKLRKIVVFGAKPDLGMLSWDDMIHRGKKITETTLMIRSDSVNPKDTFIIAYTSGTTGNPKGVMHKHNLIKMTLDRISRLGMKKTDINITSLPLFHLYAYGEAIACLLTGSCQVLTETFNAAENLDLIQEEKATIIHGFDTHYKDMLDEQERKPRDISSLRFGTFPSGAPSSIEIAYRTQKELVQTVSGWGMTETWTFATVSSPNDTIEQRCEASGRPMPGVKIKIIDPNTGISKPRGEQGELIVQSYMNMQGYYNNEVETNKTIGRDGWLRTGDTAIYRDDGHVRFLGRFKDMLKVGGENVSPLEVEAFLLKIPSISQIAIVGVPDERLNEVPAAFVVSDIEQTVTLKEIKSYCQDVIASYKIPRYLFYLDSLPMTPTGKVQKHKLRQKALDSLS